jgi:hypothetical protein
VRLQFIAPPSYFGSAFDSSNKVSVTINGAPQDYPADYCMSQDGRAYDFSFLARGLRLKEGDQMTILFTQTTEPVLARASLLKVQFSPGRAVARLFTH